MGIGRRIIWLVWGMILCQLCVGCGREADGIPVESVLVEKQQVLEGEDKLVPTKAPLGEAVIESEMPTEWLAETATVQKSAKEPNVEITEAPRSTKEPKVEATEVPKSTKEPKVEAAEMPKSTKEPKVEATEVPKPTKVPMPEATEMQTQVPMVTSKPQEHIHTLAKERVEANCLEDGWEKESCRVCGEVVNQRTIGALGHDFTKSIWELPTCQKGGYYNNICNRCDLVECVTQEPLPHEVEDIVLQEGNCMEDTVIQHLCRNCGVQVKEETRYTLQEVHSWVTEIIEGQELIVCERCGVTK